MPNTVYNEKVYLPASLGGKVRPCQIIEVINRGKKAKVLIGGFSIPVFVDTKWILGWHS